MLWRRGLSRSRHQEAPPMGETPPDLVGSVGAIGREDDSNNILSLLFKGKASIVTIHGVGGSGKSTLAKLVYDLVYNEFDLKIWISVSDTFEFRKVIKKILGRQGVRGKEEAKLRDTLRGKRLLLVLDDLWSNNRNTFKKLANFLRGCDGGKIIVTTREQSVVNMIETDMPNGTVFNYTLNVLSTCDLFLLLKLYAFGELNDIPDHLIEIGRQIVGKCKGLPLPVKILGRLLFAHREAHYWESIRDGNYIEQLLRLIHDLPIYCRDRFFQFSPLLEDEHLEEADLFDIWMVHGLFESIDGEMSPAVVENEIRSIIQTLNGNRAVLYELIRYLIKIQPTQNECLVINGSTEEVDTDVRHLSIGFPTFGDNLTRLHKLNGLQTLVLRDATSEFVEKLFSKRFVSKFKLLRMLNLKGSFLELPKCLCSIKSLRSLNLSRNKKMKELPSFIFNMASLEILRLDGCSELEILPKSIKKLSRLKILTLTTTATELPDGMECLTSLRSLMIRDCKTLTSFPISLYLSRLTALQSLSIYSCKELEFREENVGWDSNNLSLRELRLENLPKMKALPLPLPERLPINLNLRLLQIKLCAGLKKLPNSLLQMKLEHIVIESCSQLSSVPEKLSHLTSLKFFKRVGCPALEDQEVDRRQHHT